MRIALALILFTMSAFAQNTSAVSVATAACGPRGVNFDIETDKSQHTVGQPEAGKALVYVIQDVGPLVHCLGMCTNTKVALDGAWVGANHQTSYFSFAVDPGERHLCAQWQSYYESRLVGLAHFTAEAGKVYYFRTRALDARNGSLFDLEPIDSDMGKFYVAVYPLSVSHPKK